MGGRGWHLKIMRKRPNAEINTQWERSNPGVEGNVVKMSEIGIEFTVLWVAEVSSNIRHAGHNGAGDVNGKMFNMSHFSFES